MAVYCSHWKTCEDCRRAVMELAEATSRRILPAVATIYRDGSPCTACGNRHVHKVGCPQEAYTEPRLHDGAS